MANTDNHLHTALLVMDVQNAIIGMLPDREAYIQRLGGAIRTARNAGIHIVYAVVGFRQGYPEIDPNNKSFSALKDRPIRLDNKEGHMVHTGVAPLADEIIVTKRRVSAFTGSDLEVVLRAKGIRHIVLTGVATSGVVLSTLREAADKDFRITVLSDCCADRDEEVHRVLTTKVFRSQAEVMDAAEWRASLQD
jgi:nicotinamidase-related amidase